MDSVDYRLIHNSPRPPFYLLDVQILNFKISFRPDWEKFWVWWGTLQKWFRLFVIEFIAENDLDIILSIYCQISEIKGYRVSITNFTFTFDLRDCSVLEISLTSIAITFLWWIRNHSSYVSSILFYSDFTRKHSKQ